MKSRLSSGAKRGISGVVFGLFLLSVCFATLAAQKKPDSPEPLDLNTASVEQLQKLPGIGPATAKAIVRFREKSGPFRRVEDLLAVRGITKARLDKLRPLVTVKVVLPQGGLDLLGAG
jgi:competence ComEA-like helix-hairpin-helix protein